MLQNICEVSHRGQAHLNACFRMKEEVRIEGQLTGIFAMGGLPLMR